MSSKVPLVTRLDRRLITFFERPWPRKVAGAMLWGATHVERLFFLPFRPWTIPARYFLERRHAKNVRHHR
ncbi:hypothetical protein [Acidithiobacillus sp.]|uniref:hypothetical protein n=1 Tax=Acidithiobacillus sp. TaxID=1872118 RepID=UPI003CFE46F5